MVIALYNRHYDLDDIYFGIGIYMRYSLNLTDDNLEENMNYVRRSILLIYEAERRRGIQMGQNLINILFGQNLPQQNLPQQNLPQVLIQNQLQQILVNSGPEIVYGDINDQQHQLQQQLHQVQHQQIHQIQQIFGDIFGGLSGSGLMNPPMEPVTLTVPKEELEKIRIVKFKDVSEEVKKINEACTICLCEFEENDNLRIIKCNHAFHQECIDKWLLENSYKCPICRKDAAVHVANI